MMSKIKDDANSENLSTWEKIKGIFGFKDDQKNLRSLEK